MLVSGGALWKSHRAKLNYRTCLKVNVGESLKEGVHPLSVRGAEVLNGPSTSSAFFSATYKNSSVWIFFFFFVTVLFRGKKKCQFELMGELLPCVKYSWSASYTVPFKPSGSFKVKAFLFQVSSLVCLSELSPAAYCYYSTYRIINDGPWVRRAEQERLLRKKS